MKQEHIQRQRVHSIDLARGLAVLFMIWVHVLITYSSHDVIKSTPGLVVGFLGGPLAAPVFMALMGVSFYYSRNTTFRPSAIRGLKIILLGYILNILRGVLPVFLVSEFLPNMAASIPGAVADYYSAFLELDILQFAGLALIVMAIIRELKPDKYVLLLLAAVVAIVSPMLWGIGSDIPVAGHFLDYLWGDIPSNEMCVGNFVSFPFFPWFSFVLVGMFLGDTFSRSTDLHKSFNDVGMIGFLVLIVSSIIVVPDLGYHLGDYYHCRPAAVAMITGIVLTWLYVCNVIVEKIKMDRFFGLAYYWSRNVTSIYVIQWVIIMVGADAITGFNKCSYSMTAAIMIIMPVASHLINEIFLNLKKRWSNRDA